MATHTTDNLATHMSLQAKTHQQQLEKLQETLQRDTAKLRTRVKELETQLKQSKAEVMELRRAYQELERRHVHVTETVGQEIKRAQEHRLRGHLSTLRHEIKCAQDETKREITKQIRTELSVHKSAMNSLQKHIGLVPINFTLSDFEHKKMSSAKWYSPSFYTHCQGYKMCLRVDADGWDEGTNEYVSVAVYMMRGEYDDHLTWPFQGTLTIKLLSMEGNHMQTLQYTDVMPDHIVGRVLQLSLIHI